MVFDPSNNFYTFNAAKQSQSVLPESNIPDQQLYARPGSGNPCGYLIDLINKFGDLGGFAVLFTRFQSCRRNLTIPVIRALLRPFDLCHELLTVSTIEKYLIPVVEKVRGILGKLKFEKLLEETQNASIDRDISAIFEAMMKFISGVPQQKKNMKNLEAFRLKIMLKLLQNGQNIHELVRGLGLEQVNYFCGHFQTHWSTGTEKAREKLLQLMQQLAKGVNNALIDKVLMQFWTAAHTGGVSTETADHALKAHVKILDFSGSQDRKTLWLEKCIEEVKTEDEWTLLAMKQIREICNLYESTPLSDNNCHIYIREDIIESLGDEYGVINLVSKSLTNYMKNARQLVEKNLEIDARLFMPDGRYNHNMHVQERLDLFLYLCREGDYPMDFEYAQQIWQSLVEQAVFPSDREICFKWFSKALEAKWDLDIEDFFQCSILQLDLAFVTESGFTCFEGFFRAVNTEKGELKTSDLIGTDYLWRIVTNCPKEIASRARELLQEVNADLRSEMQLSVSTFNKTLIVKCMNRLQAHCDTLSTLTCDIEGEKKDQISSKIAMETQKMAKATKVLQEYMNDCVWKKVEIQ